MVSHFFGLSPLQILGLCGAGVYMMTYALLTFRILTPEQPSYFAMNLVASTSVLISLAEAFSAASFAIQVFWIAVSLTGICRTLAAAPRRSERSADRLRPLH